MNAPMSLSELRDRYEQALVGIARERFPGAQLSVVRDEPDTLRQRTTACIDQEADVHAA